jgi:hypothetical protein
MYIYYYMGAHQIRTYIRRRRELKRYFNKQARKSNKKVVKFYDNMSNITQNIEYNKEADFHIYSNKNQHYDELSRSKNYCMQKYNGCKMKYNQERDNKYDL